jgi:hypothetical protein
MWWIFGRFSFSMLLFLFTVIHFTGKVATNNPKNKIKQTMESGKKSGWTNT